MRTISAAAGPLAYRTTRAAALICAAASLTACMPLLSEKPAGDAPHPVDASREGTWVPQNPGYSPARAVSLRVKDAAHGEAGA